MSVTVDVNVLVYASNESEPVHEAARSLVDRLAAGPGIVYLFWPTLLGYLRLVTHPALLPSPLSPAAAIGNVSALLARPHVRSPGEGDRFWELFRLTSGTDTRGNDVPDAHVAALMREYGVGTIYSRDRGLRRYEGITVEDPFLPR